jgi:hypothetical protein
MTDVTHRVVKEMNPDAFAKDAAIYCWACRTGLGNPEIDTTIEYTETVSDGWFSSHKVTKHRPLLSANSLAQTFANVTGATVYAYLCRSDYEDTLNKPDELDFMDAYEAGTKGKERQRPEKKYDYLLSAINITDADIQRYDELQKDFSRRKKIGKVWFDPQGAKYPVKGGDTPKGLPQDMKTFKKLKK